MQRESRSGGSPSSETRPLCLLFGWLGAGERPLAKYASLYQELGAEVAVMRPTPLQTAVPRLQARNALKYLRQLLASPAGRGSGPVLVQCMSNAGWLAFGTMLHLAAVSERADFTAGFGATAPHAAQTLQEFRGILSRVSGVVLDSAPSFATPDIWARGAVAAALGKPAVGIEEEYPATVAAVYKITERYLALPSISRHLRDTRLAWAKTAPLAPQLYLYSVADELIPASHVEVFMAQQAKRGVTIASHVWGESGHCEHLRDHPEQYRKLVQTFMERCLTDVGGVANWV